MAVWVVFNCVVCLLALSLIVGRVFCHVKLSFISLWLTALHIYVTNILYVIFKLWFKSNKQTIPDCARLNIVMGFRH